MEKLSWLGKQFSGGVVSIFRSMVREDCPEKVVFKQIPERKEEAKLCGYQQEEHSSWRELSRMCTCWKDKEGNNVAE